MKYAQGEASQKFKAIVKESIEKADTVDKLNHFLDVLHDAVLTAKNDPDGLNAAIKVLQDS